MTAKPDNIAMYEELKTLGFNAKEIAVYLALLEFGAQPASILAKKTNLPRPTVLFLCDHLLRRGILRKIQKGRTQIFHADPEDLHRAKTGELIRNQEALDQAMKLIKEFKNPFTSSPKIQLSEGIEGCKTAYLQLLESQTEILEFAAHQDLEKMGIDFMDSFIEKRTQKKVFIKTITQRNSVHEAYQKKDKEQCREQHMFSPTEGAFYSSIAIFEDKVLLLNLYQDPFAILIQSNQVAETLKLAHRLAWKATQN